VFNEIELVAASKLSIIIASTLSAILGLLILMSVVRKRIHSEEKNNL
jgi:Na+/H+ antiporter NhaA